MSKHENKNCSELPFTNGVDIHVKALVVEDCEFVPVHHQQIELDKVGHPSIEGGTT